MPSYTMLKLNILDVSKQNRLNRIPSEKPKWTLYRCWYRLQSVAEVAKRLIFRVLLDEKLLEIKGKNRLTRMLCPNPTRCIRKCWVITTSLRIVKC